MPKKVWRRAVSKLSIRNRKPIVAYLPTNVSVKLRNQLIHHHLISWSDPPATGGLTTTFYNRQTRVDRVQRDVESATACRLGWGFLRYI